MPEGVCSATKKDGTPCQAKALASGMCFFHDPEAAAKREAKKVQAKAAKMAEVKDNQQETRIREAMPAVLPENRRIQGSAMTYAHRSISMLRPICAICQTGDNVSPFWMRNCPHDPYMSITTETWDAPAYEDEKAPNGFPTGVKILVGTTTKTRPIAHPNWAEISVSERINSGLGVPYARNKGFIRPSELRNELFPNGIAECCEWGACRWQQGLHEYKEGRFCREDEARLAAWDVRRVTADKKALEVGWNTESEEKRQQQLQAVILA